MFIGTVVGRLGRDAEIKTSASGTTYAKFSVATDHGYGDKKVTTWVEVTVFGKSAEFAGKLAKGDQVAVSGKTYLRTWEKDGVKGAAVSLETNDVQKIYTDKGDGGGGYGRGRDGGGSAPPASGGGYGGGSSGGGYSGGGQQRREESPLPSDVPDDDSIPF